MIIKWAGEGVPYSSIPVVLQNELIVGREKKGLHICYRQGKKKKDQSALR